MEEVTSKSTPYPTVAEVQTSKQGLAEITSGRPHSLQELAITCKDPPNEAKAEVGGRGVGLARELVGAMKKG
jgi:hypothetical protein